MYLTLVKGPMWAGKSTELCNLYRQYKKKNTRILAMKHKKDTRYSSEYICTHDGGKIPCITLDKLVGIEVGDYDVILIDEAQWFSDLYEFISMNFNTNIRIHVAGLSGDKNQHNFGQVNMISPYCSKETIKYAICDICGDDAPFSKCKLSSPEIDKVGGSDEYYAVCHKHINTSI